MNSHPEVTDLTPSLGVSCCSKIVSLSLVVIIAVGCSSEFVQKNQSETGKNEVHLESPFSFHSQNMFPELVETIALKVEYSEDEFWVTKNPMKGKIQTNLRTIQLNSQFASGCTLQPGDPTALSTGNNKFGKPEDFIVDKSIKFVNPNARSALTGFYIPLNCLDNQELCSSLMRSEYLEPFSKLKKRVECGRLI